MKILASYPTVKWIGIGAFGFCLCLCLLTLISCGKPDSDETAFLKKLKTIAEHDNLSDAPFVQKTLGVILINDDPTNRKFALYRLSDPQPLFASESFRYVVHSNTDALLEIESKKELFCIQPDEVTAVFGEGEIRISGPGIHFGPPIRGIGIYYHYGRNNPRTLEFRYPENGCVRLFSLY